MGNTPTQKQLANGSGYSQQMISYLLSAQRRPYLYSEKFRRLCQITKTHPHLWMIGSGEDIRAGIAKKNKGFKTLKTPKRKKR